MSLEKVFEKLEIIQQQHVLEHWEHLTKKQKKSLENQIKSLDLKVFFQQQKTLKRKNQTKPSIYDPFTHYHRNGNLEDFQRGETLLEKGKMGTLMVAGGQGTRLKFDGPKGMYPVTPLKNKTLYQLFAEKTVAASKRYGQKLQLAIMTSPLNHQQTVAYFEENLYFGLDQDQLSFFSQGMLPFLDENGNLILKEPYEIAEGPDGNGSSLKHFIEAGIWDKWHDMGIRHLNFIFVDNPLADPFDAELLGYHHRNSAEVTIKCTERNEPEESVGILLVKDGVPQVVEYTEIPKDECYALTEGKGLTHISHRISRQVRQDVAPESSTNIREHRPGDKARIVEDEDGVTDCLNSQKDREKCGLKHVCANISLFCFDMSFIKRLSDQNFEMPLHLAYKSISPTQPKAWKFESFIFDILPFATGINALLYPRSECFSPLKNLSGKDSVETVKRDLQEMDRRILQKITGRKLSNQSFELSQEFYYPTPEFIQNWKGKDYPDRTLGMTQPL